MRRLKDGRDISAQTAAKARYNAKNYDKVQFYIRKGGHDMIALLADDAGMSIAEYLRHCVIAEARARGIDVTAELGGGGVSPELAERLRHPERRSRRTLSDEITETLTYWR